MLAVRNPLNVSCAIENPVSLKHVHQRNEISFPSNHWPRCPHSMIQSSKFKFVGLPSVDLHFPRPQNPDIKAARMSIFFGPDSAPPSQASNSSASFRTLSSLIAVSISKSNPVSSLSLEQALEALLSCALGSSAAVATSAQRSVIGARPPHVDGGALRKSAHSAVLPPIRPLPKSGRPSGG